MALLYIIAVAASLVSEWISLGLYVAVAMMWFIPEQRSETHLTNE